MYNKEVCVKVNVTNNAASSLVQRSMRYDSEVTLEQSTRKINAKSIMGVISLGLKEGTYLMVTAKGDDEQAAVTDLVKFIESDFKL